MGRRPCGITVANIESLMAYANANMKIYVAAKESYRDKATVKYHLEQVKQKTGLDPRNFYDLVKLVEMLGGDGNDG